MWWEAIGGRQLTAPGCWIGLAPAKRFADKPHYVKLTPPLSSDESCGTRSALACRLG
ncbi:hypothetical protein MHPYR_10176 [uncultured Mycobacterium sp.]|uniref:Uncharacterized protein n=1 Tax=uncultured Mycobacterium sp. TaxID=171292 RepID=A0A1Y5NVZ3_9MYCO|nr:hypothetical protein MHPYR_10176 [uncultured Mycobacterium sp.]